MATEKFFVFNESGTLKRLKGRIVRFLDNEDPDNDDKVNIRASISVPASAEGLTPANNLSDVSSVETARSNLSVNSIDEDAQANGTKTTAPALYFNGSSSYIQVADDDKFSFTNGVDDLPFSISAWVKPGSVASGTVVAKNNNSTTVEWTLRLTAGGFMRLGIFTTGGTSNYIRGYTSATLTSGQVYHICFTYDGSSNSSGINAYVNGLLGNGSRDEVGTYAGMSNTTSPVQIGLSSNGGYFDGHIYGVKIFNRTLTADEIAELARGNDLGFSEEFGGANGGVYTSDFSAGVDGWSGADITVAGNIDSIGGQDDNLRSTMSATSSTHRLFKNDQLTVGKRYRVGFDYYIPSTNTATDGFGAHDSAQFLEAAATRTLDAWTRWSLEFVASTDDFHIYWSDGANANYLGIATDVAYIRNVSFTEIGTLADFRAEDYNESASKLLDRSSNNFVGVGTSVTLTGNQRHISADTIDLKNLPTSSAGLSAGEVWSNGGVLTVV